MLLAAADVDRGVNDEGSKEHPSMSSTIVHARTTAAVRPVSGLVARFGRYVESRQSRRELQAVLAGHHGSTVRAEVLARLTG